MTNLPIRVRFPFSKWLPVLAVLLSAAIVLVPAGLLYMRWKTALGSNQKLMLGFGDFRMILDREHLLRSAVEMTALNEQWTICILNTPGRFLVGFVSQTFAHHATWFPDLMGPFLWKAFSFPLLSIPAWFFVGRGIDGILIRRGMRRLDLILSAVLVLLSVAVSAGLRFGLSESERGDKFTVTFIYGFALWSLLFALPLVGWVRQRTLQRASIGDPVIE